MNRVASVMEKPEDSYRGKGWTCFENEQVSGIMDIADRLHMHIGTAHVNETDAATEIERLRHLLLTVADEIEDQCTIGAANLSERIRKAAKRETQQ